jgi:phosphatidylserine/phosphatidylglycerophosphate/cardiolipin synthase-like enzyme
VHQPGNIFQVSGPQELYTGCVACFGSPMSCKSWHITILNCHSGQAPRQKRLAAKLSANFSDDLSRAQRETLEAWEHRPVWERGMEWLGWLIAREQ